MRVPTLNIPALLSPPCQCLPLTFLLQLQCNDTRDIISPCGVVLNCFPCTVSLAHPLSVLSHLPFPLPILDSLPFPGLLFTTLCVLLPLAIIIDIVITLTSPSHAQCTGIRPCVIIIILDNCLVPIRRFNVQHVAMIVLPTVWRVNLDPEIMAPIPREMLTGVLNLPRGISVLIGAIDLIPKSTGTGATSIVDLVTSCVKHVPHIRVEICQPQPKRRTPESEGRPHQLELF